MNALGSAVQSEEVHIAGVLVQARPQAVTSVREAIAALDGAELAASADDGRLAVVVERDSTQAVMDLLGVLRELPGVFNVALVYQHAESLAAMQEVLDERPNDPAAA